MQGTGLNISRLDLQINSAIWIRTGVFIGNSVQNFIKSFHVRLLPVSRPGKARMEIDEQVNRGEPVFTCMDVNPELSQSLKIFMTGQNKENLNQIFSRYTKGK